MSYREPSVVVIWGIYALCRIDESIGDVESVAVAFTLNANYSFFANLHGKRRNFQTTFIINAKTDRLEQMPFAHVEVPKMFRCTPEIVYNKS